MDRTSRPQFSFRQLFSLFLLCALGLFFAGMLQAWTGPTGTPPASDAFQPINTGTSAQIKNAGLSVNAFTSFGSDYVQNKVGVGTQLPVVALDVAGAIRIGNGGEACSPSLAGALRYNEISKLIEFCNGTVWGNP